MPVEPKPTFELIGVHRIQAAEQRCDFLLLPDAGVAICLAVANRLRQGGDQLIRDLAWEGSRCVSIAMNRVA